MSPKLVSYSNPLSNGCIKDTPPPILNPPPPLTNLLKSCPKSANLFVDLEAKNYNELLSNKDRFGGPKSEDQINKNYRTENIFNLKN